MKITGFRMLARCLFAFVFFTAGCAASKTGKSKSGHPVAGKLWSLPLPGNAMLNMVWVAPGTFAMGSPVSEAGREVDERTMRLIL